MTWLAMRLLSRVWRQRRRIAELEGAHAEVVARLRVNRSSTCRECGATRLGLVATEYPTPHLCPVIE